MHLVLCLVAFNSIFPLKLLCFVFYFTSKRQKHNKKRRKKNCPMLIKILNNRWIFLVLHFDGEFLFFLLLLRFKFWGNEKKVFWLVPICGFLPLKVLTIIKRLAILLFFLARTIRLQVFWFFVVIEVILSNFRGFLGAPGCH